MRSARTPPMGVNELIDSLLETELNADAHAVHIAVIAVHAAARVIPVEADTPCVRKMVGSGQTAEELSAGFASANRRRGPGFEVAVTAAAPARAPMVKAVPIG